MLIRYCISFPGILFFNILTWFVAPVIALPFFIRVDIFGRQQLVKYLKWFSTYDNPVDEWWRAKPNAYYNKCFLFKGATVDTFENNKFYQYIARLFWICRNPAYGFGQYIFGWNGTNSKEIYNKTIGIWDSGSNNYQLLLRDNRSGLFRYSFQLKLQWFFYKKRFLRINMGYKPHKGFTNMMISIFISPFRVFR